jgi:hypothetical protein
LIHHPRPSDFGCGQAAQPADFARIANDFSVEDLALQTFFDVFCELGAAPFDDAGRPIIDFDANEFHNSLPEALREMAIAKGVAEVDWGDLPYPENNNEQFARLLKAYEIDPVAAIKATYWGLDYTNIQDADVYGRTDGQKMIVSTFVSEANQIELSMLWAQQDGGLSQLANRDWTGLATEMFETTEEVQQYAKIFADTYDQLLAERLSADKSANISPTDLARLQRALSSLGIFSGQADGIFGAATFDAIKAFQLAASLPVTGTPDTLTVTQVHEETAVSK